VTGHILRSEGNCTLVPPCGANPVRINKGTATARTVEEVRAIQFVKVFFARLLRSKLLESCSFPRYQVKCALFPHSLVFVLKLVVAGSFRKNGRLKLKSLKSGALLSQGPQHCFIDDLIRAYALCFYPHQWKFSSTPVRTVFAINTTEFYHPHRTVRSDMVIRSDLSY